MNSKTRTFSFNRIFLKLFFNLFFVLIYSGWIFFLFLIIFPFLVKVCILLLSILLYVVLIFAHIVVYHREFVFNKTINGVKSDVVRKVRVFVGNDVINVWCDVGTRCYDHGTRFLNTEKYGKGSKSLNEQISKNDDRANRKRNGL